ncbi:MAG: 23S rRNA (uracil(1939)-C(5))-methyltransferase, partial [Burkholderiales bacterium]|nr:23S rRNA (uracil(1939)-C(5))-methyltransferase [Burkholderiales bacterium]
MNTINIRSLDMDARGVGHLENEDGSPGKVVFVEGALPGEVVGFNTYRKKPSWEAATLGPIVKESSQHRARLSVRNVHKKGMVLVGFHEKKSRYVANMETCEILPPHISAMLMPLRDLISSLTIIEALPQIELAIGEGVTAMVLRIMTPLGAGDAEKLKAFADQYQVQGWLQTAGPDSAT